jgi:glycosyltransferase involved in cell wall biosynthesis
MASIIIPCWNQREFTRQCIAALMRHTRVPWELIVVDNGSTDGTGDYLAGVQDAAAVPVTVIANATNRGFPAAINQGLQVARGEFLVLLNNDVVVTDGWLDQLIALASARTDLNAACLSPPLAPPPKGGEGNVVSEGVPGRLASAIGLVGPMSNYAAPPQLVAEVPYRDIDGMQAFARQWRDEHHGQWFSVPKLSGFCLLMKRAVYETIGGLDERFGLGFFDDDDLAERARRAGFGLAVAHDLFVHHFGSRTFLGNGIDTETLLDENAQRFAGKWGLAQMQGRRVALRPFGERTGTNPVPNPDVLPRIDADGRGSEGTGSSVRDRSAEAGETLPSLRSAGGSGVKVSLTMIVRNEQENLPNCLESARGLFDEIVVVDTGSTDRTKEIALGFGARVIDFLWVDDFAAARNAALEHATGDYAFWLDADDVIDPGEREKVRALLDGLGMVDGDGRAFAERAAAELARGGSGTTPPDPPFTSGGNLNISDAVANPKGLVAYVVRCACDPSPDGTGGETVVDHVRLFPLRADVRWTYRVHEQIMPALRRAGIAVRWSDCTVRHTGYSDLALRARKLDRDSRILREELKDRPNDPFVLFNLGSIAIEQRDWRQALEYLKRSLARSAPTDSITCKLFALIARAHQMLGDPNSAIRTCEEGLKYEPADAELWFRKAVIHRHRGESAEAESCWRRILTLTRPEQFRSVDLGIYGHLTRRNLAALAAERGDHDEVERLWRAVLAECPGDCEAIRKLATDGTRIEHG